MADGGVPDWRPGRVEMSNEQRIPTTMPDLLDLVGACDFAPGLYNGWRLKTALARPSSRHRVDEGASGPPEARDVPVGARDQHRAL
jgi:hypothetical protein